MRNRKRIRLTTEDATIPETEVETVDVSKLPEQGKLEFYQHFLNREIMLDDDVTPECIDISEQIMCWNREDQGIPVEEREPIRIFINTNGGCTNTLMHLIDVIGLSKTPVYTIGMGKVFSAGCYLLMAGHRRFVFPNTEGLMHDGSMTLSNTVCKFSDTYEHYMGEEDRLRQFVLSHTKISGTQYSDHARSEWYVVGQEMVELGVADQVVTDLDEIL